MKLVEVVSCTEEHCSEELRQYVQQVLRIAGKKQECERLFRKLEEERVRLVGTVLTNEEREKRLELKQSYDENAYRSAMSTLMNLEEYHIKGWMDLEE